jgi:hypothetical protein
MAESFGQFRGPMPNGGSAAISAYSFSTGDRSSMVVLNAGAVGLLAASW